MDAVSAVLFATTIYSVTRLIRYAKGRDINGIVTLLIVWAVSIGVVFLFGESDFSTIDLSGYGLGEQELGQLNAFSKVLLGSAVGSFAVFGNDILGAIDNTRTTQQSHIVEQKDWS